MIYLLLLQYSNENAILPTGLLSYWDWEIRLVFIYSLRACACTLLHEFKPFCKTNMEI